MNLRTLKNLGVVALLCFVPMVALANPLGSWTGSVTKGDKTINVQATFAEKKVDIHFSGVTEACQIKADYQKPDGRALTYQFGISSNGGSFCDGLIGNVLEVEYTEGAATMEMSFGASGKWSGQLDKQNP